MPPPASTPPPPQELRFCRSADGTRIAYARHGSGPPLLLAACWLSHLQHDWQSPVWRHFLADLGRIATVIRYDERGHGLSDWDVEDFGLEARIADIEAVVADAGLDRFALMAMSQGGPPSIAYAHRHPGRVERMVFYGSFAAVFHNPTPEDLELDATFEQLIKVGYGRPDSAFRRVFTSLMIPDATEEQMRWLDELQRVSTSPDNALAARRQRKLADVAGLLPDLDVPTLVVQARDDRMSPFERSRRLASGITGARMVVLDSANHILLSDEPAWPEFLSEVTAFLQPHGRNGAPAAAPCADLLSPRELAVLRLAAEGRDNASIAESLTLSVRTVERHLHNTYAKLGIQGKAARAAAVARLLR